MLRPLQCPTAEQTDDFLAALRPLEEATESVMPSVVWTAFRSAVDTEMSWLLPKSDPIGQPMTLALRELQARAGKLLEQTLPDQGPVLHKYVNLAVVVNADGGKRSFIETGSASGLH